LRNENENATGWIRNRSHKELVIYQKTLNGASRTCI
jgi:hypothetical protein